MQIIVKNFLNITHINQKVKQTYYAYIYHFIKRRALFILNFDLK